MWERFKTFLKRYEWVRQLIAVALAVHGIVAAWLGGWATVLAVVASGGTTAWAVIGGASFPFAIMGGVCMLAAIVVLVLAPTARRSFQRLDEMPIPSGSERVKPNFD